MRRNLSNLQTAVRAAAPPESHHHLLVCLQLELRSPRRDRSPRRWRLARSLAGSVNLWWDLRECEFVELLVGTGATTHVCGPHDFTHSALKSGPCPVLKTGTGELLKHHGTRTVDFRCQGEELRVSFTIVDVKRPILSVSRLMDRGIETFIQASKQILRRFDGATVELTRRGGRFVLQRQAVVPMLLALVDEEPAGKAVDEEMERELMGREVVEPPVPIEVPAPDEPTSDERRHHGLTHLPDQPWCNVCVRARERENRHVTITKPARHTRHPMRLLLLEDRGRFSNGHSPSGHRYSVQTDGFHSS